MNPRKALFYTLFGIIPFHTPFRDYSTTPASTQKLFLVDAIGFIHRSHFIFSQGHIRNSQGINTGPSLGFTNALVAVLQKEKPTHIVVAFDKATPTWRHQLYQAYKAHRQAQPEDITVAIPHIKQILQAFRIPVLDLEGYEADDIIGTLAYQAARKGFEVYMMTSNKDLDQLVSEHIYLYKPSAKSPKAAVLGIQAILEKWEIDRTDQVRDILALQGDPEDNIPGVPTIGIKTAQKLIRQFDSVENLIAKADQLTDKLRENLLTYSQQAILAKKLTTVQTDIPLRFDIDQSRFQEPNLEQLRAIFQQLEFHALARRVLDDKLTWPTSASNDQAKLFESTDQSTIATLTSLDNTPHQYHLMNTPALRQQLIRYLSIQNTIAVDTETTGLDPHQVSLLGISWAYRPGEAYYVPIPENYTQARAIVSEFKSLLENPIICKVGQNIKYDILVLQRYGVTITSPLFDTMIAHYLLEPTKLHNMSAIAQEYLAYTRIPIEELIGHKRQGVTQKTLKDVDLGLVKEYACEDADITLRLKQRLQSILEQENMCKVLYEVELPLVPVLTSMESHGVPVDTSVLPEIATTLDQELQTLAQDIYGLAGCTFNINSPKQLGNVLFGQLKLTKNPKKTPSGRYATERPILTKFAKNYVLVAKILEYKKLKKLKSTHVDALPSLISPIDGRLHTGYKQAVIVEGRLSSAHPNLRNIPACTAKGGVVRKAFVPSSAEHVLLTAGYSQIELRIMASLAQEKTMIEAFKAGQDIHKVTASRLFKVMPGAVSDSMRYQAKMVNFSIIYDVSAFRLAQQLGVTKPEAMRIIQAYFAEFPAVKAYIDGIVTQARKQGYVTTLMGRKKFLPNINSHHATMRDLDKRNAINVPIQGTATEMTKLSMIRIHNWLGVAQLQSKLILQVQDQLVFDVPKAEVAQLQAHVPLLMKNALPLTVPVEVELGTGRNWLEAH